MTVVESGAEAAFTRRAVTIPPGFDPTPSIRHVRSVEITVADEVPAGAEAVAVPIGSTGDTATRIGLDRPALAAAGFDGDLGQTHVVAGAGARCSGGGRRRPGHDRPDGIRDAAAAFALATRRQSRSRGARPGSRARRPGDGRAGRSSRACCSPATATTRCRAHRRARRVEAITLVAGPVGRDAVAPRGRAGPPPRRGRRCSPATSPTRRPPT